MSERYSKLFALPENLYAAGAPVLIAAGALLKDGQTGKVLAQLKFRNIQDKAIKALTVRLATMDTTGKPLGDPVEHQYLDLTAPRNGDFGAKTPIVFPDASTRAFSAVVTEVIFGDNTLWTASDQPWEPLSQPVTLEQALEDRELVKQFRLEYGKDCKVMYQTEKDLWRCPCGALNRQDEEQCHQCGKGAAALAALDLDGLKARRDERLEQEAQAAAERKAAAEAQMQEVKRQTKKWAKVVVPVIVVVIVAVVLISSSMKKSAAYNDAVALVDAGEYEDAIAAFQELGDYKDSAERVLETKYDQADALIKEGDHEAAIALFTELGDYKDSEALLQDTENLIKYSKATSALSSEDLDSALTLFEELGDYKDSAEQAKKIKAFQWMQDPSVASDITEKLEKYNDGKYDPTMKYAHSTNLLTIYVTVESIPASYDLSSDEKDIMAYCKDAGHDTNCKIYLHLWGSQKYYDDTGEVSLH